MLSPYPYKPELLIEIHNYIYDTIGDDLFRSYYLLPIDTKLLSEIEYEVEQRFKLKWQELNMPDYFGTTKFKASENYQHDIMIELPYWLSWAITEAENYLEKIADNNPQN